MFRNVSAWLRDVFVAAPGLGLCAVLMIPDIALCIFGLQTDNTIITGMQAWDKPLKFGVSTLIYTGSLAVIVRYTKVWPKLIRTCEFLVGFALAVEIVIIDLQAARHTTSHFNVATRLDTALWATMGGGIGVLYLSSILLTVGMFRSFYHSRPWTTAIRWGMVIAILGMGSGVFMAVPSRAQQEAVPMTHHLGAHTIGGTDGGPGLPLLNWSTKHGDVRPAHFIGMHALQVLFLFAVALEQFRVPEERAVRLVRAGAVSYVAIFLLVLIQALSAVPITDADHPARLMWTVWIALTAALLLFAYFKRKGDAGMRRASAVA